MKASIMKARIAPGGRLLAFASLIGFAVASPMAHSQTFSVVHRFNWSDGANPLGGLTVDGTSLYGTTSSGGKYGMGTVFEIDGSGKLTVLYEFTGGKDGGNPEAALIRVGGQLLRHHQRPEEPRTPERYSRLRRKEKKRSSTASPAKPMAQIPNQA